MTPALKVFTLLIKESRRKQFTEYTWPRVAMLNYPTSNYYFAI